MVRGGVGHSGGDTSRDSVFSARCTVAGSVSFFCVLRGQVLGVILQKKRQPSTVYRNFGFQAPGFLIKKISTSTSSNWCETMIRISWEFSNCRSVFDRHIRVLDSIRQDSFGKACCPTNSTFKDASVSLRQISRGNTLAPRRSAGRCNKWSPSEAKNQASPPCVLGWNSWTQLVRDTQASKSGSRPPHLDVYESSNSFFGSCRRTAASRSSLPCVTFNFERHRSETERNREKPVLPGDWNGNSSPRMLWLIVEAWRC